jgi:hypothetical protein
MIHVLLFYSVYISGFYLSLSRNLAYSFALYEVVHFFYPQGRWWGQLIPDVSYSYFVVLLVIFLFFLNFNKCNRNSLLKVPAFKWAYCIFCLYLIASLYAIFPESHFERVIYFLKLLVIISIAYKLINDLKSLNIAIWGYIFGSFYLSLFIFQTGRNSGNRVEGIGTVDAPDANGIAAALAPSLVLALYYFWTSKKYKYKLIFIVVSIFIVNALFLINSRGAFLGAFCSMAYFGLYLFLSSLHNLRTKSLVVLLAIVGSLGLVGLADDSVSSRILSMTETTVSEGQETGATRMVFWVSAWELAKDHPFGTGIKGFEYYSPFYVPQKYDTGRSRNRAVHSTWFEALSEIGYLGLFCSLMMVYSIFKGTRRTKQALMNQGDTTNYFKVIAIEAALISFIVSMTFLNSLRAEILYWLLLYASSAYNIFVLQKVGYKNTNE